MMFVLIHFCCLWMSRPIFLLIHRFEKVLISFHDGKNVRRSDRRGMVLGHDFRDDHTQAEIDPEVEHLPRTNDVRINPFLLLVDVTAYFSVDPPIRKGPDFVSRWQECPPERSSRDGIGT